MNHSYMFRSTVVLIRSKTNTLSTVPSHTLDDLAAIRTEPGLVRSCQNSQRVHHETPASTQTDSNRPASHLAAGFLFWLPTRSSRSAPSSPDSKRLNLSRFGFYHLCFSSPGQHGRHGNIRNKLHSNNNHQTAVKQLRLCFSLQTVTSSLISVFTLQSCSPTGRHVVEQLVCNLLCLYTCFL